MTTDIKTKLEGKGCIIFDPVMTAELKAKVQGKDFFILDPSSNDSASWTEWDRRLPEMDRQNIGHDSTKHEGLEGMTSPDIFEPFAGDQKSGTQTFYVRPGAGKAFYFDMMEPKRVSREVNQILQAVPLIQQNGLEYKGPFIEIVMSHV